MAQLRSNKCWLAIQEHRLSSLGLRLAETRFVRNNVCRNYGVWFLKGAVQA